MAKKRKRKPARPDPVTMDDVARVEDQALPDTPTYTHVGMPWPDGTGAPGPRAGAGDAWTAEAGAAAQEADRLPADPSVAATWSAQMRGGDAATRTARVNAAFNTPVEGLMSPVEEADVAAQIAARHPGATPVILQPNVTPGGFTDPVDGRPIEVDPDRPRTPVRSASEALETHLRFRHWLRTPDAAWAYGRLTRKSGGDQHIGLVAAAADQADTIFVSPEMSRLAAKLAEADGDTIPVIHRSDVPAPFGLVILGDPQQLMPPGDNDGPWFDHTRVRGLLWATADAYGTVHTPDVDYEMRGIPGDADNDTDDLVGPGGLVVWELYDAGDMLVGKGAFEANGRPPMLPGVTSAMPFEQQLAWHETTSGPRVRRYLGWLLRIMWQRIAPAEDYQPSRAQARRWERAAKGRGRTAPKVMQLRRFVPTRSRDSDRADDDAAGRTLDHAIVVRGHPRDHHYATLGPAYIGDEWNPASHRRIWIAAYPKGPRGDGPPEETPGVIVVNR